MHRILLVVLSFSLGVGAQGAEKFLDWADFKVGETPEGFRSIVSGREKAGRWRIVLDDAPPALPSFFSKSPQTSKQHVLAQLSRDKTDEHFPMLMFEGEDFGDFTLRTRIKIVGGEVEQMAGIAFRIQDERNYYYIRANAKDNNLYFFKRWNDQFVERLGPKLEIATNVWYELTIECKGNEIRCLLNGQEAIPALQDNNNTFKSGKIAFWTKSDSVAHFGSTHIVYTPSEPFAQALVRHVLKKYPRLRGLKIFARTNGTDGVRIVASADSSEIGSAGGKVEEDVITRSVVYHGKGKNAVIVTMPLHDQNGEPIAAVSVLMNTFPGQTEKNAIARAMPVIQEMESRVRTPADLNR